MSTKTDKMSSETTPIVGNNKDLLSEIDLARRLGVTIRCVQAWRLQRWGPKYIKVGRLVRYPRAEVDAFLARQTIETEECRDEALARRRRGRQTAA